MDVFTTSDGYRFERTPEGTWTDGDLTFDSDSNGLPIDADGEPLEGELTSDGD